MSSAKYSVLVSDHVKTVLQQLQQSDRPKCRMLALLLLRLEKDPKPEGSRELCPDTPGSSYAILELSGRFLHFYTELACMMLVEVNL